MVKIMRTLGRLFVRFIGFVCFMACMIMVGAFLMLNGNIQIDVPMSSTETQTQLIADGNTTTSVTTKTTTRWTEDIDQDLYDYVDYMLDNLR
jgi:hypothetical protein